MKKILIIDESWLDNRIEKLEKSNQNKRKELQNWTDEGHLTAPMQFWEVNDSLLSSNNSLIYILKELKSNSKSVELPSENEIQIMADDYCEKGIRAGYTSRNIGFINGCKAILKMME